MPASDGIRNDRRRRASSDKSSGVQVISCHRTGEGEIVPLTLYARAKTDNLTGATLKEIRLAIES